MDFESLFVRPGGRTPRGPYLAALATLLAVVAFYALLVTGRTAQWCLLVLVYPAFVLHARRLHDMGRSAWPLVLPVLLMLGAFAIWLGVASFGTAADTLLPPVALAVTAGFALWGCIGRGQAAANRFGAPVAAQGGST